MPIDSRHPQYRVYQPQWQRARDACAGEDAIKARGTAYLPRPSGMDPEDYAAYKLRPHWFGATARTRQGLKGLMFREAPVATVSDLLLPHLRDITRTGVSVESFAEYMVEEHLTTGHVGILVDLPDDEQPANRVRPQWTLYKAEQIINWYTAVTPNGETVYSQVVLEEMLDVPDAADPYTHTTVPQWRELLLLDGVYVMRLWRKTTGVEGERFVLIDERIPHRRGASLDFLPFVTEPLLEPPPLLDVVDVNISHYRTNADYHHELHMTSLATAYVTGWDNTTGQALRVGSLTAWIIPEPQARVGFLEVSGHGLAAKLAKLQADQAQMAVLGARLLEPQQRAVESGETHQIRQSAELSIMEAYTEATALLLTKALRWHAWWAGTTGMVDDPEVTLTLTADFLASTLDAPTLTALVAAWNAGALTQEDLYYNLAQGDVLEPGITFEAWRAKLEAQAPLPLMQIPVRSSVPAGLNGTGSPDAEEDDAQ